MSNKSSNRRKTTAESFLSGRRNITPGATGRHTKGKKLCRGRTVKAFKLALAQTRPEPKQPVLLVGHMRPQRARVPGPYDLCPCGSGRRVKWCRRIGLCETSKTAEVSA